MSNLRHEVKANSIGPKIPKQTSKQAESSSLQHSPYRNRVLTCLVITPAGRPLKHFRSVLEVLEAFRDAITAHQSLFLERHILHRDISMNNIILTDPAQNNGRTGMLIDLDLAVRVGEDGKNETSNAKHMTGTLEYMAIQVLEKTFRKDLVGIEHTYRHDLESFFYVFLSICIRYGWAKEITSDKEVLRAWYTGTLQSISRGKRGEMDPGGFESNILYDFSPMFEPLKPLARKLRNILFTEGPVDVDTPEDPSTLYKPMVQAFEAAVRDLKCRQIGLRGGYALKEISYNERLPWGEHTMGEKVALVNGSRKRKTPDNSSDIPTKRERRE